MRRSSRGQTIPVWAFGTLAALVLIAAALNYGAALRWQIRAQNAADAAARGMLSIQTTQFNQMVSALHAAAIEEYRLRYITNDLLEVIQGSGGCDNKAGDTGPATCNAMYASLRQAYLDSLQRYTQDVVILNRASYTSQQSQISQMQAALALYQSSQNCGTPKGGDCAFKYTLVNETPRTDQYLENVYADCCAFVVGGGTSSSPKADLAPLKIELVACAAVAPTFPSVFKFGPPTYTAIGRSAATSIMSTQEFMYVGSLYNPITNNVFQPSEFPESNGTNAPVFGSTNDANYRIDYGGSPSNQWNSGNPASSDGNSAFMYTPTNEGLLAATGWWQAMAIKPFSGQLQQGVAFTCK